MLQIFSLSFFNCIRDVSLRIKAYLLFLGLGGVSSWLLPCQPFMAVRLRPGCPERRIRKNSLTYTVMTLISSSLKVVYQLFYAKLTESRYFNNSRREYKLC
uniref:Uncharacterized protein n=1 Tax=Oreochromis aureus TaxID=47969 RepID=A0A668VD95_OREAU